MIDTTILTVGAMLGIALVSTLIAIWWRLGRIGATVDVLVQQVKHDSEERLRLWKRIDNHADRIVRIETKQEATG